MWKSIRTGRVLTSIFEQSNIVISVRVRATVTGVHNLNSSSFCGDIEMNYSYVNIRKNFDQYINLRPVKLLKGAPCPLKDVKEEDINMTFVRENTEGEYAGSGSWLFKDKPNEVVIQDGVFSRKGCERVIRYAYELAKKEGKTFVSTGFSIKLLFLRNSIILVIINSPLLFSIIYLLFFLLYICF